MNCPSCGAAMRLNADEDYLKCDYCKSIFFPAKDDEGVSVLASGFRRTVPRLRDSADARSAGQDPHSLLHALPRHADSRWRYSWRWSKNCAQGSQEL